MVRLSELWYRHYEDAHVLVLPDGRALEYREDNPYHAAALTKGWCRYRNHYFKE